ncbi:MAG: hypothetical protein Q9207_007935 [Kuettlingeria erythrocarpa]
MSWEWVAKPNETDGFLLEKNRWDSSVIDHILMSYLIGTPAEKQLQQAGYLGSVQCLSPLYTIPRLTSSRDYTVTRDGICWRTEVAVRTQTLTNMDWKYFVRGIHIEGVDDKSKAETFVQDRLLGAMCREAERQTEQLNDPAVPLAGPRQVLIRRWREIQALVEKAADALQSTLATRPVHTT